MNIAKAAAMTRDLLLNRSTYPSRTAEPSVSRAHLDDMLQSIEEGKVAGEKAHRWLGWVQGVLCCLGGGTLEEMKSINKRA